MSKRMMDQKGFTLIELLLVVVVMGLMLAVIVPRGQRATVDSKYALVRQAASELGSFGSEWAEGQTNAQQEISSTTMDTYLVTLVDDSQRGVTTWASGMYAYTASNDSNWIAPNHQIGGRNGNDSTPEVAVRAIVPPEKEPRNPFNGASYFAGSNNKVTPGALQLATVADDDGSWHYYAFVFYGTDNLGANSADFFAGQGAANTIAQLRNGVFMTRTK